MTTTTNLHPHHFTPGERRVVNGTEYVLVPLPGFEDAGRKRFAGMFTPRGVCGGCPFECTPDCVAAHNIDRLPICRADETQLRGATYVIVPVSLLPILALEGLLP